MTDLSYGFGKQLPGATYEQTIEQVTAALKEQGFGVLTEIDVKTTLKKKIDVDFRRYIILGACNPKLAHRALQAEPHIGLLLPCNVVVQETDGGVEVSIIDPKAMFNFVDSEALESVAQEAEDKLKKALEAL